MKNPFNLLFLLISIQNIAQIYVPDSSFGNNGSVVTNYNMYYDNNQAPTSVLFENNKYILAQKTQLSCFNYDGTVDYTFGTMGISRIIFPNCPYCPILIKNLKIINDNIYVFGKLEDNVSNLVYGFIAKMSLDGNLDTNFGNNGILSINIGALNLNNPFSSGITDFIYKDGNYFAIGNIVFYDSSSIIRRYIFAVKLNNNGIIDLLFDTSGIKKFTSIDGHSAEKIYEYEGDLLIIGNISPNNTTSEHSATLLKIDENGNPDALFGINGLKKIVLVNGLCSCGSSFQECNLLNNNLYYLLSYGSISGGYIKLQKIDISTIESINPLNSVSITDIATINSNLPTKYLIDTNKIYILDCINNCEPDFNITKRNLDGTLDTTFNQTGTYSFNFPSPFVGSTTYDSDSVFFKHQDNKIFIGGYTGTPNYTTAPYRGFAMARIKDENLSNNEFEINPFSIFPNPVQTDLTIVNEKNIAVERIVISDVLGKMVYSTKENTNKINIENLNKGIYFVTIFTANKNERFKVIKGN